MQKQLYLLLVFLSFTLACSAQNKDNTSDQVSLIVKNDNECVTYNFGNLKDLEENLELVQDEIVKNLEETTSFPLIIELKTVASALKSAITSATSPRTTVATAIKSLFTSLQKELSQ
jgi:hypothetical protein